MLPTPSPSTLFEKVWRRHVVAQEALRPAVLYVDLHLVHEVTSPQAFAGLRGRGLKVRRPDRTVATMDHSTPTVPGALQIIDPEAKAQLATLRANCEAFGIELFNLGHEHHGIVHVIGPELGLTQPGQTIVCGDSHTSTHGAFGALAFGIGTSEVEHVLATQCLLQVKPRTLEVQVRGTLPTGVTAKDLILAIIAQIGTSGGAGHVIEYTGSAVRALDMEARMTVCNMSIEAGARAGLIAPDDTTFEYLLGRPRAPSGEAWQPNVERWRQLRTDDGAEHDRQVSIDAGMLQPMLTYGTNPQMALPIGAPLPDPRSLDDAADRATLRKALDYMRLEPGKPLLGKPVDVVFIGSCTNSRITDLRAAASVFRGRKVPKGLRVLVVPGSAAIKRQADAEGLGQIFTDAGAQWREPGCSMCIAMNDDRLRPGELAVSTSNRNFEGRQGPGGRTLLASPITAAAAAVTGRITDPRALQR